jgi:hypothetical protein
LPENRWSWFPARLEWFSVHTGSDYIVWNILDNYGYDVDADLQSLIHKNGRDPAKLLFHGGILLLLTCKKGRAESFVPYGISVYSALQDENWVLVLL